MFKKDLMPGKKQKLKTSVQRGLRQSLVSTYPLLAPHIDEILPKKADLSLMKLPDRNTLYVLDREPLAWQSDGAAVLVPHLRLVHRFPHCFPSVRIDAGAVRFVLSGATLMAPGLTSKGGRLPRGGEGDKLTSGKEAGKLESGKEGGVEGDNPKSGKEGGEGESKKEEGEGVEGDEGTESVREGLDEDGRWSRELQKGEVVVIMAEGKEEACAVGVLVMGTDEVKNKGKGPVVEEAHFLGDGLWRLNLE